MNEVAFLSFFLVMVGQSSSMLSGKHLIVTGLSTVFNFNLVRNSSGEIVQISGVGGQMLDWLSSYYNLTYSPLQISDDIGFDDVKTGMVGFVQRDECDIVGSIMPTQRRVMLVDFSHPALYNPSYFLIPAAKSSTNLLAATLPFQTPVWIGIVLAILFVYAAFYGLNRSTVNNDKASSREINIVYIFGLLLDQSGQNLNRKLPILLVAAAWCLSTLVLVTAYSSLLTSYITAPNPQPLIKSVREIRDRPDVWVVTNKNRNPETFLVTAESGLFKELGDKLRANPHSSCDTMPQCVGLVKSGFHVYISSRDSYLLKAMADDFRSTQRCDLELGKEEVFVIHASWALKKYSPYTPYINNGIIRMSDAGLISHWMSQYQPKVRQCTEINVKHKHDKNKLSKLSMTHLLGAFIALLTGYVASLTVFIGERFVSNLHRKQFTL